MTAQHTPTPLTSNPVYGSPINMGTGDHGKERIEGYWIKDATGKDLFMLRPSQSELAAFIVRAVNSHDALCKFLSDLKNFIGNGQHEVTKSMVIAINNDIDRLLALAKGEA